MADEVSVLPERKLTAKQEKFCRIYATDAHFFGNGTMAYAKAYNVNLALPGQYQVASQGASENLRKPHIARRINQLLEDIGFSDVEVDKQLAFVIAQHGDLKAKMAGIREYNALKKRTSSPLGANVNIIALILKQWGLENVGEDSGAEKPLPENGA